MLQIRNMNEMINEWMKWWRYVTFYRVMFTICYAMYSWTDLCYSPTFHNGDLFIQSGAPGTVRATSASAPGPNTARCWGPFDGRLAGCASLCKAEWVPGWFNGLLVASQWPVNGHEDRCWRGSCPVAAVFGEVSVGQARRLLPWIAVACLAVTWRVMKGKRPRGGG